VLVLVDHFSRFTLLEPLKNKKAQTVDSALSKLFERYTFPTVIRSDNEPLFKQMGKRTVGATLWKFVAPYSPFSNGICERIMSSVGRFIKTTKNWLQQINKLQARLNSKPLPEGYTPFEIVYGRDFRNPMRIHGSEVDPQNQSALRERRVNEIKEIRQEIRESREQRLPTRAPPALPEEWQKGDFVIRVYDEKRTPMVIQEVRPSEQLVVINTRTMKRTIEHMRNIRPYGLVEWEELTEEMSTGGTDVEDISSSDSSSTPEEE
jgi:hypothetical protein